MQVRCLALPQLPRYTMFPSSRSRDADPGRVMPKYRDSFMGQIELEPVENSSRLTISVWSDNSILRTYCIRFRHVHYSNLSRRGLSCQLAQSLRSVAG